MRYLRNFESKSSIFNNKSGRKGIKTHNPLEGTSIKTLYGWVTDDNIPQDVKDYIISLNNIKHLSFLYFDPSRGNHALKNVNYILEYYPDSFDRFIKNPSIEILFDTGINPSFFSEKDYYSLDEIIGKEDSLANIIDIAERFDEFKYVKNVFISSQKLRYYTICVVFKTDSNGTIVQ